jgi:hypothetical protein
VHSNGKDNGKDSGKDNGKDNSKGYCSYLLGLLLRIDRATALACRTVAALNEIYTVGESLKCFQLL